MKKKTKIFLVIIVIIALFLIGSRIHNSIQAKAEYEKTAVIVKLDDIYDDYLENEVRATETHIGNRYKIIGRVFEISSNAISLEVETNHPNVLVGSHIITAYFSGEEQEEFVKTISNGDFITVEGTLSSLDNLRYGFRYCTFEKTFE